MMNFLPNLMENKKLRSKGKCEALIKKAEMGIKRKKKTPSLSSGISEWV